MQVIIVCNAHRAELPPCQEKVNTNRTQFDVTACVMTHDPNATCHYTTPPDNHCYNTTENRNLYE